MQRFVLTIFILILAIVVNYLPSSPGPSLSRLPLKDFPPRIGDWSLLKEQQIDEKSMAVLQVDDYIQRTYCNSEGETVSLYIGYFNTQKEGKTNHSPRQCLTGAGWFPVETAPILLQVIDGNPGQVPVNRYLMTKGSNKELFLFWYHGRGRHIASEYQAKAYLIWDSMTKNRTDGALVRLNSTASPNPVKALQTQTDFIRSFYPILSEYIPE
jgi:EpsI family protein